MFAVLKSNLGRRVLLLVSVSMLVVLGALVISGWLAVRYSSQMVREERQSLATSTGHYLDYILRQNLERLDAIGYAPGVDLEDSDTAPEKAALHDAYLGSIFDEGVMITDMRGDILLVEPPRPDKIGTSLAKYPFIQAALAAGKPAISDVVTIEPTGERLVLVVSPLRNREGRLVSLAIGQLGQTPLRSGLVVPAAGSNIDIVDGSGTVIASNDPRRILRSTQELAAEAGAEVVAFDSLDLAPWTVAVRQPERAALAPVRTIEQRFIIFGVASLIVAMFLSWGMARSLIKPIYELKTAAQGIAAGDLAQPIARRGGDELGELGASLDSMRVALKKSLEDIQELNKELEAKVAERTRQLEDSYREIGRKEAARGELLRKVMFAQEEERKRIARELHDETTQSLAGLVMRLEAAGAMIDGAAPQVKKLLADVKSLAVKSIDNVHQVIFDLRPSVLDDLGLLPAIRWYANRHLAERGIALRIEVTGEERKLAPQFETALFRVVQEAINNTVKHAEAHSVVLSIEYAPDAINIEVEDDGKGFDPVAVSLQSDKARGLGLLGMEERITLIGGRFYIESQPGRGTHLTMSVPLPEGVL